MKRLCLSVVVICALLVAPQPSEAGIGSAVKKVGHVAKVAVKKVGQGAEWVLVGALGAMFCLSSGQCQ